MVTPSRTFRLDEEVVAQMDALVREGVARNRTELIARLVRREAHRRARDRRDRELADEYARAWADPEYRAEQEQIEREFWPLDVEAWKLAEAEEDSGGP